MKCFGFCEVGILVQFNIDVFYTLTEEQRHFVSEAGLTLYILKCLSIGTPKAIFFPFVPNGKLLALGVPIFEHIIIRL